MAELRATRSLLDELMGKSRNLPSHKRKPINWKDQHICKSYVCGWCPIRDFHGSKADIGICEKKHNEIARVQFQRLPWRKQKRTYAKYMKTLEIVKRELDFRTRRSNDKLLEMLTASQNSKATILAKESRKGHKEAEKMENKVDELYKKIQKNPEESSKYVTQLKIFQNMAEDLRNKKDKVYIQNPSYYAICEACGALNAQTQDVLEDHGVGQVHMSYVKFQDEYTRMQELFDQMEKKDNEPKDSPRKGRSRSRSKDRDRWNANSKKGSSKRSRDDGSKQSRDDGSKQSRDDGSKRSRDDGSKRSRDGGRRRRSYSRSSSHSTYSRSSSSSRSR